MGEKRKPSMTMLLRNISNKRVKLELFNAKLWGWTPDRHDCVSRGKYRLRVNGAWNDLGGEGRIKFMTKYEFRDLLFRCIVDTF